MRYFIERLKKLDERLAYNAGHIMTSGYQPNALRADLKEREKKLSIALDGADENSMLPIEEKKVNDTVLIVLSSYDSSDHIEYEHDTDRIEEGAELLYDSRDDVDTVGHYKTSFFDPGFITHWNVLAEEGLGDGSNVSLYAKALKENSDEARKLLRKAAELFGYIEVETAHSRYGGYHIHEFTVTGNEGLHMRPAMQFCDIASGYDGEVLVQTEDSTVVDGKSIMQVSLLKALEGAKVKVMLEDVPDADTKQFFDSLETVFRDDISKESD